MHAALRCCTWGRQGALQVTQWHWELSAGVREHRTERTSMLGEKSCGR